MKRILLLLALCCSLSMTAQGLRQSVCVVYPKYSPADSALLASYAESHHRAGLVAEGNALDSYAEGSFGSGFVVEQDERMYVLTNRHVVGYASEATIAFHLRGANLVYEHCPVYSSSKDADLSIILLPVASAVECTPLVLAQSPAQEGEEITAVGFPSLNGKASWQLSRGTISNSSLAIEDGGLYYIQHTAPIDPGSSGGPLLRKTNDSYSVLGINTLKAFYRERVGIAISNDDIRAFLATLSTPDTTDRQQLRALHKFDAKRWHEYYGQLPKATRDSLKDVKHLLPLDLAMTVYEAYDVLPTADEDAAEAVLANDRFGVDYDLDHHFAVVVGYENFFNRNSNYSVAFEIFGGYYYHGARLSVPVYYSGPNPDDLITGLTLGYGFGVQLPLRFNRSNKLVPHAMAIAQAGFATKPANTYDRFGILIAPSLRVGADYRLNIQNIACIIGLEYVFQPTSCSFSLGIPANLYLQNGLNARIGIGF